MTQAGAFGLWGWSYKAADRFLEGKKVFRRQRIGKRFFLRRSRCEMVLGWTVCRNGACFVLHFCAGAVVVKCLHREARNQAAGDLEHFSSSRGVSSNVRGGFFLRKKALGCSGLPLQQLENCSSGFRPGADHNPAICDREYCGRCPVARRFAGRCRGRRSKRH
jgi:hypothetical protein